MEENFVPSRSKLPGRRIWTIGSRLEAATCLLMFLDAELYLERVSAIPVVEQLEKEGRIPPMVSVYVSNNGLAARHSDYVCDVDYSSFLADELLPFVTERNSNVAFERAVLIGLSLSGLAAAHAALITNRFRVAICQSPSFWWNQERFAASLRSAASAAAFWVSVGNLETEFGISHPPSGLFQGTSQRDACDRGSAALRAAGYTVSHRVFQGGHDPACWREDLMLALPWATSA